MKRKTQVQLGEKSLTCLDAISDLSLDELIAFNGRVVEMIRRKNYAEQVNMGSTFRLGQTVSWTSTKRGKTLTGTVEKLNQVTATVKVTDSLGVVKWNVPFSLLRAGAK